MFLLAFISTINNISGNSVWIIDYKTLIESKINMQDKRKMSETYNWIKDNKILSENVCFLFRTIDEMYALQSSNTMNLDNTIPGLNELKAQYFFVFHVNFCTRRKSLAYPDYCASHKYKSYWIQANVIKWLIEISQRQNHLLNIHQSFECSSRSRVKSYAAVELKALVLV